MLSALSIRDIVLIDALDLNLEAGLFVLTGETGAGKSIMLDALGLALGGRGDGSLVRRGAQQGSVSAVFEVPRGHRVFALLDSHEIAGDGELILRRVQSADGRTRAFINDAPVAVKLLRDVGGALVEIHGQHDDRALLEPGMARRLLDAFAGLEGDADAVRDAWDRAREARTAFERARDDLARTRSEQEFLRHAVAELDQLAPAKGEEQSLADTRRFMMHAEKFAAELGEAHDALAGDGTADARLAAAARRLERIADKAGGMLDGAIAAIDRVLHEMAEARDAVSRALEAIEYDQKTLEQTEERLFALRAAARKHNVPADDLAARRDEMARALAAMDADGARLAELEKAAETAMRRYRRLARDLSKKRTAAAARLDKAVMNELPPLKLEKARFATEVTHSDEQEAGRHGLDRVSFLLAANPGSDPAPLMKAASGGELARVILALKVVLAARGSAPTLVFDEVDSGVSGATAEAIGMRLARLSQTAQVLAVTHSPQVAARAGGHMRVTKVSGSRDGGDISLTRVDVLEPDARREEIARMLAGANVTDEARAAAARLIGGGT